MKKKKPLAKFYILEKYIFWVGFVQQRRRFSRSVLRQTILKKFLTIDVSEVAPPFFTIDVSQEVSYARRFSRSFLRQTFLKKFPTIDVSQEVPYFLQKFLSIDDSEEVSYDRLFSRRFLGQTCLQKFPTIYVSVLQKFFRINVSLEVFQDKRFLGALIFLLGCVLPLFSRLQRRLDDLIIILFHLIKVL